MKQTSNSVLRGLYVQSGNDIVWKLRQLYQCEKSCGITQFKNVCDCVCAECILFLLCFFALFVLYCLSLCLSIYFALFSC